MQIEYEATFENIDKDNMREKLQDIGAICVRSEYTQKRAVFHLPKGHEIQGGWLRVRDEAGKIVVTLKVVDGAKIENQKEINLGVDDFSSAVHLLESLGCIQKAYQVTKRELWKTDGVEVTIDEWPHLEPFVEIEGLSEEDVQDVAKKLGFDYSQAVFGAVDVLYSRKYTIDPDVINNQTPLLDFDTKNPFQK